MATKKIELATHISIALSKHERRDLIELHKELFKNSEIDYSLKSKMDIVMDLANEGGNKIEQLWIGKLFAASQTFTFVKFYDTNEKASQKNKLEDGLSRLKKNIDDFKSLSQSLSQKVLTKEPKLLRINIISEDKYAFMFGALGRTKYIPVNYKYEIYQEPKFYYCVWDNRKSTLQIRAPSYIGFFADYFAKNLINSPIPIFESTTITRENFDSFVTAIDGTVRTARGKNRSIAAQLETKEIGSKSDLDVREADNYETEMGAYDVLSHGIDFEYKRTKYRVYIGFKKGTLYIKKGSPTEDLIDYLQRTVNSVQE